MANRAYAADARRNRGHLEEQPSLRELFKSSELIDMQVGLRDLIVIV